jgi:hypothetical protein
MHNRDNLERFKVNHLSGDDINPADLRKLFARCGEVSEVRIHWRKESTFALVELYEAEGKEGDWLDPINWHGRKLTTEEEWS